MPPNKSAKSLEEGLAVPRPSIHKALPGYSTKGGTFGLTEDVEIDDDGVKRTGGIASTFFLIITAVIGSGVLSLPNAMAMLGWPAGILCLIIFAWATLFTSQLLADCHVINGKRTRTYIEQVYLVMGRRHGIIITWVQQCNLVLAALAYSITASYALTNVAISVCEGQGIDVENGGSCFSSYWRWALIHGGMQIFFSFVPDMDSSLWPCVLGACMSFSYATISLGRAIAEGNTYGTVGGITGLSTSDKVFGVFNAMGAILFAYSFSLILPEIQDTIKDSVKGGPMRAMKKTVNWTVFIMTAFYMAVAISGYMAYGNDVSGNILDSFQTPRWLVDMANIMVFIHLLPAYQVWSQPFFYFLESNQKQWWSPRPVPKMFTGWWFRAWFRPLYVVFITFLTVCLPFFSYIIGLVGALGFWPTTVYYPIRMWIRLYDPSPRYRAWLYTVDAFCFVCSIIALMGSIQQIVVNADTICFFCG
ncbi:hypothetical protein ABPG75_012394 [Micractinium tetrahymenae]